MELAQHLKYHFLMNSKILKEETQHFHEETEKALNADYIFSNRFEKNHYENLLLKTYLYIDFIQEATKNQWATFSEILMEKKKAIKEDLVHLNSKTEIEKLNKNIDNASKSFQLGLIYVSIGAMLGNKMILKKLNESHNYQEYPFHYLTAHQQELPEIWKFLQNEINILNPDELADVINGAKFGYQCFQ